MAYRPLYHLISLLDKLQHMTYVITICLSSRVLEQYDMVLNLLHTKAPLYGMHCHITLRQLPNINALRMHCLNLISMIANVAYVLLVHLFN